MRYGADITLKAYNFLLQGEYIFGDDKGSKLVGGGCGEDPTLVAGNFKSNGYWFMAMYETPWYLQPLIKYQTYDQDDASDYDIESSWIFGFNYFFNDWTRLQVNYMYNIEESSDDETNYHEVPNDMLMVQLQIKIQ